MQKIKSINGLVDSIIENRRKTQSRRFTKLDDDVEKVKDVLDGAMAIIAEKFAPDGFKYAKSKRAIYRTVGGFRHEIQMDSGSSNLSGVHVGARLTVSVRHNAFKKWEASVYNRPSKGFISIRQIGDMTPERSYLQWELVDTETRKTEIESMIYYIKNNAITFFEHFNNIETFHDYLRTMNFQVLFDNYAVNFAAWLDDKPLAEKIVRSILEHNGASESELKKYIAEYKNSGYPDEIFAADHAKCWAQDSIILGLFEE